MTDICTPNEPLSWSLVRSSLVAARLLHEAERVAVSFPQPSVKGRKRSLGWMVRGVVQNPPNV